MQRSNPVQGRDGGDHVRIEQCPLSVHEDVAALALQCVGGDRNPRHRKGSEGHGCAHTKRYLDDSRQASLLLTGDVPDADSGGLPSERCPGDDGIHHGITEAGAGSLVSQRRLHRDVHRPANGRERRPGCGSHPDRHRQQRDGDVEPPGRRDTEKPALRIPAQRRGTSHAEQRSERRACSAQQERRTQVGVADGGTCCAHRSQDADLTGLSSYEGVHRRADEDQSRSGSDHGKHVEERQHPVDLLLPGPPGRTVDLGEAPELRVGCHLTEVATNCVIGLIEAFRVLHPHLNGVETRVSSEQMNDVRAHVENRRFVIHAGVQSHGAAHAGDRELIEAIVAGSNVDDVAGGEGQASHAGGGG